MLAGAADQANCAAPMASLGVSRDEVSVRVPVAGWSLICCQSKVTEAAWPAFDPIATAAKSIAASGVATGLALESRLHLNIVPSAIRVTTSQLWGEHTHRPYRGDQ